MLKTAALDLVPIESYLKTTPQRFAELAFLLPRYMQKKLILSKLCYYDIS